ncbi:MAG: hypothetical protein NC078_01780 [Ruminococcus sp.]|nr:hypothetical protein [Ruminococcus sp.]
MNNKTYLQRLTDENMELKDSISDITNRLAVIIFENIGEMQFHKNKELCADIARELFSLIDSYGEDCLSAEVREMFACKTGVSLDE